MKWVRVWQIAILMPATVNVVVCKASGVLVANLVCVSVHVSRPDRRCRGGKGKWCCSGGGFVGSASIVVKVLRI